MRSALAPLLVVLGCSSAPSVADEQAAYVGHDKQVPREALRFADPADQTRFDRVHACFAARTTADDWRHYPLRRIGNFVQENWCRGDSSSGCAGGSFRSERGDEWYDLSTLHYDRDWPQVFGLGVSAGRLPVEGEWGVSFEYHRGGAQITGEGLTLAFHRFADAKRVQTVALGGSYSYKIEETTVTIDAPGGQDDELRLLTASAESLKTTAETRLDALLAAVERHLDGDLARKCVYGPYEGGGVPPICTPTPLTADERAAARTAAQAELGARREAVARNADAFHGLLAELMRFDRCW